jgi:hypothetical protein
MTQVVSNAPPIEAPERPGHINPALFINARHLLCARQRLAGS